MRRVTVVVPVYGDWNSLRACVKSLIEHASADTFDVLLVNDCGPDADEIEAGLRGLIYGRRQFRYERNPRNLGFGGTCNRAVLELDQTDNDILLLNSDTVVTAGALDELRAVLNLSPQHGTVCPRSNDATIATVPFFQRIHGAERDSDRALAVHKVVSPLLPRFYIAPVSVGFCLLIRRSAIREHGLFDDVYGRGYNEENDFCLRINEAGYSSLIANRAFVYHVGSTSFGSAQREELEATNSRILHQRYPYYPRAVATFIRYGYAPADRFADLIVPTEHLRKPKVLVDISTEGAASPDVVNIITSLAEAFDVTIAAHDETARALSTESRSLRIVHPDALDEVFDLALVTAPVTSVQQLAMLNRYALRWIATVPSTHQMRSTALRAEAPHTTITFGMTLAHADGLIGWETDYDIDLLTETVEKAGATQGGPIAVDRMTQGSMDWVRAANEVLELSPDLNALEERERAVLPVALAVDAQYEALTNLSRDLDRISRSRIHGAAQKVSAAIAPIRRVIRG